MAEKPGHVLKKKISAIQARGYHFPVLRALAQRLEQATIQGAGLLLGARVEAVIERSLVARQAAALESLPEAGLRAMLRFARGRGDGAPEAALAALDTALVDHVVDILMGGDVEKPRELPPRAPTAIDAALCRRFVERVLARFDEELKALAGEGLGGVSWGGLLSTPADLAAVLPERQYLVFRLALDIGAAGRTGAFHLILPLALVEPVAATLRNLVVIPSDDESEDWARHMRRVVATTRLALEAVLERSAVCVAELARLEVGEILPLPDVSLADVALEIEIAGERRRLGRGQLGSLRRNKAVKITEPPDPELLAPLREALGLSPDADLLDETLEAHTAPGGASAHRSATGGLSGTSGSATATRGPSPE